MTYKKIEMVLSGTGNTNKIFWGKLILSSFRNRFETYWLMLVQNVYLCIADPWGRNELVLLIGSIQTVAQTIADLVKMFPKQYTRNCGLRDGICSCLFRQPSRY